ncbi:MAG: SulP family inorganic anion transporter, partial [Planctomycetota bacterium]|nr:SulP family inorganic anion transporter [Planctomycetota bacterium]
SGFLVFLIAMPLCLAIAKASNFPPIAGIWTAVIGGVVTSFISNSQLTIKGPAAGLIVIVAGAVTDLGKEAFPALPEPVAQTMAQEGKTETEIADALEKEQIKTGYRLALGVGVVAGVFQIGFALLRAGKLGDFFPLSAVHGMLASIGIIIISKQAYPVFGVTPEKGAEPLHLLAALPGAILDLNPEIACIGVISLLILFGLPWIKIGWIRKIPAPIVVLLMAVPLGIWFDLNDEHVYSFSLGGAEKLFTIGPKFLVEMPEVLKDPGKAFFLPDFSAVASGTFWKYVAMFSIIASLESLLSAKAIELIDPWRRKTDFNRDLLACGIANTLCASIGALPMISEIVRSKANVDNGATNRTSNLFHGLFLLAFVLLVPNLIHRIPLAALGAMLVFTGFRLAHPREFINTWRVGPEQLAIFVTTIVSTLATDLLIGIGAGITLKLVFHIWHGRSLRDLFRNDVEIMEQPDGSTLVKIRGTAVFSNWLGLKAMLTRIASQNDVVVDLSETRLVDHSTMEKLHELEHDVQSEGRKFELRGLAEHRPFSQHPLAGRKRVAGWSAPSTADSGSHPKPH